MPEWTLPIAIAIYAVIVFFVIRNEAKTEREERANRSHDR